MRNRASGAPRTRVLVGPLLSRPPADSVRTTRQTSGTAAAGDRIGVRGSRVMPSAGEMDRGALAASNAKADRRLAGGDHDRRIARVGGAGRTGDRRPERLRRRPRTGGRQRSGRCGRHADREPARRGRQPAPRGPHDPLLFREPQCQRSGRQRQQPGSHVRNGHERRLQRDVHRRAARDRPYLRRRRRVARALRRGGPGRP